MYTYSGLMQYYCTRWGHIGFIQEISQAKAISLVEIMINENTVLLEEETNPAKIFE